jgi:FHS family L-fucose permease-like MFS transporter
VSSEPARQGSPHAAFIAVTTLFLAWGFITATIDPLIPSVRAIFHLSYTQSMLTQFAFFMAYGIVSLPGATLVARLGYGRSIFYALLAMIAGCLVIPVATYAHRYALVLVALFIIASGITVLQVAANPLAAALGPPSRSHFRLTLSQAFNSLGTVIGPYFGSLLMLQGGIFAAGASTSATAVRETSLRSIDTSFLLIALLIAALALFIRGFSDRLSRLAPPGSAAAPLSAALQSRWALLGAAAIFLYVGAEVAIGSMLINFLHQPDVLGVSFAKAAQLLSLYWLGAMLGRFAGSVLLTRLRATMLLAAAAAIAALLCLTVSQGSGAVAATCAIAVGLFNSIMFPTIFTVTLERSSAPAAATSGLLCMAIVGGAILPPTAGLIADSVGLHWAFLLPMTAYVGISIFSLAAGRARITQIGLTAPVGG